MDQIGTQLDAGCVIQASDQFWQQMLAMTLEPWLETGDFCVDPGHVLGGVSLSGAWQGRIEVRLAGGLAREATAAMLMMPVETVGEEETIDAAKEIANIIAGVIKSALPRPCAMTVPEAAIANVSFSGGDALGDSLAVAFRHTSGEMMVRICEEPVVQGA